MAGRQVNGLGSGRSARKANLVSGSFEHIGSTFDAITGH